MKSSLGNDDAHKTSPITAGIRGQSKDIKTTVAGISSHVHQPARVITQSQEDLDEILAQEEAMVRDDNNKEEEGLGTCIDYSDLSSTATKCAGESISDGRAVKQRQLQKTDQEDKMYTKPDKTRKETLVKVSNPYQKPLLDMSQDPKSFPASGHAIYQLIINRGKPSQNRRTGGRYLSELYGLTEEEREWRKSTKISDIVIDINIWLTPGQGRRPYRMDEGVQHVKDLLDIIQSKD